MFNLLVSGGRDFNNYQLLKEKLNYYLSNKNKEDIIILSGHAKGTDTLAEYYASETGIKLEIFPANWDEYGKSAGFIRNAEMINKADALIAFWDGKSKGTKHAIDLAKKKNIRVVIVNY